MHSKATGGGTLKPKIVSMSFSSGVKNAINQRQCQQAVGGVGGYKYLRVLHFPSDLSLPIKVMRDIRTKSGRILHVYMETGDVQRVTSSPI